MATKSKIILLIPILIVAIIVISGTFGETSASFKRNENSLVSASIGNLDLNYRITDIYDEEVEVVNLVVDPNSIYSIHIENDTGVNIQYEIWYDYGNYLEIFEPPTSTGEPWPSYVVIKANNDDKANIYMNYTDVQMLSNSLQAGLSDTISVSFDTSMLDEFVEFAYSDMTAENADLYSSIIRDFQLEKSFECSLRIYAYTV